ncbi:MAG TPA: proton-conducting transporter membrane subunit [Anaerolineales bacterium]
MSAPALVLGLSLLLAVLLIWLQDRQPTASAVAGIGAGLIGALVLLGPIDIALSIGGFGLKLDTSLQVLGRSLVLDGTNRAAVGFIYLSAAFIFGGGWAARPNRHLFSAGMAGIASLSASLMVRPFLFAAVFLEAAALAFVLILSDPKRPALLGGQRLFTFFTLSMMATLMAGWMLDVTGVTGSAPPLVGPISGLLGLGFAVLLLVPPFHLWLPPAADQSDSYSLGFVVVMLYAAGYFFVLRFFNAFEWLRAEAEVQQTIRSAGIAMIAAGTLWAAFERRFGRMAVYLLLADLGASLLVLGSGQTEGYRLGLGLVGVRTIGVALFGLGASVLRRADPEDNSLDLFGSAFTNPLPVGACLVGLLGIVGAPLTAGFPGRWGSLQLMASVDSAASLAILGGMGLGSLVVLRWLWWTLSAPERAPVSIALSRAERSFLLVGIGLVVVLGFFPQLVYPWVVQSLTGLSNLTG